MNILGIETSCDETSVAIVSENKHIHSLLTLSQLAKHQLYGGVVPEIAARSHIEHINELIGKALTESNLTLEQIDGIAVTAGPGLIGGVIVGVMTAKALASVAKKPFIAVNHLEGHSLTIRLTENINFPYLMLLVSGGHCQLLEVLGVGKYKKLGSTIDDAIGEAFDKVGKMLNLDYPGGPEIEKLAKQGNPEAYQFPKPLFDQNNCNFSFAGLKTAVKRTIDKIPNLEEEKANIAASFQRTIADILNKKVEVALKIFQEHHPNAKNFVLAGGVAANLYIRNKLTILLNEHGFTLSAPPIALCTDNAAMIAWVGIERLQLGLTNQLDFEPRSRWPLEELII